MKYIFIGLLAITFWSCEKTHVMDLQTLPAKQSEIRGERNCVDDFEVDFSYYKGYWRFNAYQIDKEILQIYWTLDGEITHNVSYPLTGVSYKIPQEVPCTVCVTYISIDGCHRKCVDVDPTKCDYKQYEEYTSVGR